MTVISLCALVYHRVVEKGELRSHCTTALLAGGCSVTLCEFGEGHFGGDGHLELLLLHRELILGIYTPNGHKLSFLDGPERR